MEYELSSKLNVVSLTTGLVGSGGLNTTGIDLAGYESGGILLNLFYSSGTGTVTFEHSDSPSSGFEAVPAEHTNNQGFLVNSSAHNGSTLFSYTGKKRYIRLSIVQVVPTLSIIIGIAGLRSDPKSI